MLSDTGRKIQRLSKTVYALIIIFNLILSVVLWIFLKNTLILAVEEPELIATIVVIVLFAITALIWWAVIIFFIGFGEMVEDTRILRLSLAKDEVVKAMSDFAEKNITESGESSELPPL